MTLVVFSILCMAAIFAIFKFNRTSLIFLIFSVLCFFAVGSGLFAYFPLIKLQDSYIPLRNSQWHARNCIIQLGGGTAKLKTAGLVMSGSYSFPRILETLRLYLDCKKSGNQCFIILSGGDPLETGKTEAQVVNENLQQLGVIREDIILEPRSRNTFKNAEYSHQILSSLNCSRIFLVTSGFHIKRSLLYFQHFGVHAIPAPADYINPRLSFLPTGYNFAVTDMVFHEYIGILRYYVYNYLGWNAKPAT